MQSDAIREDFRSLYNPNHTINETKDKQKYYNPSKLNVEYLSTTELNSIDLL